MSRRLRRSDDAQHPGQTAMDSRWAQGNGTKGGGVMTEAKMGDVPEAQKGQGMDSPRRASGARQPCGHRPRKAISDLFPPDL